ncbi:hypothetical protein OF829_08525 [Sphingomonas sp. LB-2]|uniref:hypothetical protein n=1 Tax=Sphingomonas caeni TaxID=2984949 RepID=UPI00222ED7C8|nr:hypothetical protein [Sphingomonas caeni]MCW3847284.1 hypothetical protein [Sphingomonas caeni]
MNKLGMAGVGLLLFLISWRQDALALLAVAAVLLVGAAIALQLRPSLADIVTERRAPTGPEFGAALGGLLLAYVAFGALDGLLMAYRTASLPHVSCTDTAARRANDLVWMLIAVAWTLIAVAPGLRSMLGRPAGGEATLWPIPIGMLASAPIAFGLYMLWLPVSDALRNGAPLANIVALAMGLPVLALLLGPGGFLWLGAWRAAPGSRFDPAGVLGATIRPFALAWAMTGAVGVYGFVTALGGEWTTDAKAVTALILAAIAAAWVAGLWRLRGPERCGWARAGAGWIALATGNLFTVALPAQMIGTGGWATLMLLLGLPLLIGAILIAALLVPWILRRLIREAT